MAATGRRVGYRRLSTLDQTTDHQLDRITLDRIFTDTPMRDGERPQLSALLEYVDDGDTVVVDSMDRLARNLDDLRKLVRELTSRGVRLEFVKEQFAVTGEESPIMQLPPSVIGFFAEFERTLIRERQREGIALAKQRGIYRGRKRSLSAEQVADLRRRAAGGRAKTALATEFGISRQTVYQYLSGHTVG